MNVSISKIICFISLVSLTQSFFSKNHKKCRIVGNKSETSAFPVQRLPLYSTQFPQRQFTKINEKIDYQELQFIFDKYVGAGGSGEVFQIEEQSTGETRILKRFFQENSFDFQQQNFIMKQMNYPMKWHKQDNNPNKSTMASYPSKDSASLRDLEVQDQKQSAVLFYKICKQIEKAHKKGIIHNDLKMGNILINSIGQGLSTLQVQLIDWNLASFYTKGYQTVDKKGTVCYYPPEALIRTNYLTPAIDIWALGVVYFTFLTNKKPFTVNCKDDNFEAILSLVSSQRFLQVFQKYNLAGLSEIPIIEEIKRNKFLYEGISLSDRIPEKFQRTFDEQMIDLFQKMLEVDPEYRLTIEDVLKHPFFDRIKKLPKMYESKNKEILKQKNQDNKTKYSKHVPANNLVQPLTPSQMREETFSF